jgi:ATP-binding cassette subfamily B protein
VPEESLDRGAGTPADVKRQWRNSFLRMVNVNAQAPAGTRPAGSAPGERKNRWRPRTRRAAGDGEGTGNDETTTATAAGAAGTRAFSVYDHIQAPPDRRSVRKLPRLIKGALELVWRASRQDLLITVSLQLVSGIGLAVQLLAARRLLAVIVSTSGHHPSLGKVLPDLALVGAVFAVVSAANVVQGERTSLLSELVSREASKDILDVACVVDLEAYESPAFYDRLERARFNALNRNITMVNGVLGVISGVFTTLAVIGALLLIQPVLVLIGLIAIWPMWMASTRNSATYFEFMQRITPVDRERTNLNFTLSNKDMAKEIRAFASEDFLRARYEVLYDERIDEMRKVVAKRIRRSLAANIAASVTAVATLAVLVHFIVDGSMSLAAGGTAVFAIIYMAQSLRGIMGSIASLYQSALLLEDVQLFLLLKPNVEALRSKVVPPPDFGSLRVDNLSFTYLGSDRPALQNVDMQINAGEVVALVGANGSGKTTLAKLLAGLYLPDSGRILWDDTDVTKCDPVALRRAIAVIFQDFNRYWLSAAENIGIGAPDRIGERDLIIEAAKAAGADPYLENLWAGYDTILSRFFDGGTDLSVGQWQRVALARALFRQAPLIIMDEPTSALDARGEHDLFKAIAEMAEGRSVLLISHRFSTVRLADRIYVLRNGQVTEHGTHDQLMAMGGWYSEMFTLQASSYLVRDDT